MQDADQGTTVGDRSATASQPADEVAKVKLEIKLESGQVLRPENAITVSYGVESTLEIPAAGVMHRFLLNVKRQDGTIGDAEVLSITVGYDRDGEAIIAPFTFNAKAGKLEVLHVEPGIEIRLTIT